MDKFDAIAKEAAITRSGALKLMGSALLWAFVPFRRAEAQQRQRILVLDTYCDPGTLENCVGYLPAPATSTPTSPSGPLQCAGRPKSVAICGPTDIGYFGCQFQSTGTDPHTGRPADRYGCAPPRPRCGGRRRRPCKRR